VRSRVPAILELHDTFDGRRDDFAVVLMHARHPMVGNLAEVEPFFYGAGGIAEQYWQGRRLPFPILFDGTNETWEAFGTLGYFEALIDPDGNLVRGGGVEMLQEILSGEPVEGLFSRSGAAVRPRACPRYGCPR